MNSVAQNIFDLGVSLNRVAAEQVQERRLMHLEKSGPAFSAPADPEAVATALIRSGFELRLERELGRPLTVAESMHCQMQAELALRREDLQQYEDDKGDAVGETVQSMRARRDFDMWPDWQIREIAQEAISRFRAVEVRGVR